MYDPAVFCAKWAQRMTGTQGPTADVQGPTTDDRRPTTDDRRPTTVVPKYPIRQ
jgi:hypothetical protein